MISAAERESNFAPGIPNSQSLHAVQSGLADILNVNPTSSENRIAYSLSRASAAFFLTLIPFSVACDGGRITLFDPLAQSLSRQNAAAGVDAAGQAQDGRAEAAFRRALMHDPRNASAHAGLARIAARSGREQIALEIGRAHV